MKNILLILLGLLIGCFMVFKLTRFDADNYKKMNQCTLLLKKGKIEEYRRCKLK